MMGMCGRFTIIDDIDKICLRFSCSPAGMEWKPRYNAAPGQNLPVVVRNGCRNELRMMRWGLVPFWAKDEKIGSRLINARVETAAEKPSFKSALQHRRCLIPADGYYEWQKTGIPSVKRPYRIHKEDHGLFSFAGLWEKWVKQDGNKLFTFCILTADAQESLQGIHDRMPVILPRDLETEWLNREQNVSLHLMADLLHKAVQPSNLTFYPVANLVNSPNNDLPACIEPAAGDSLFPLA